MIRRVVIFDVVDPRHLERDQTDSDWIRRAQRVDTANKIDYLPVI